MRILYKPRNASKGEKITYRTGDTLVSGETYEVGVTVDGKIAAGLLATGDAEKLDDLVEEKSLPGSGSGETRKRKTKRERSANDAKRFLGFGAAEGAGEIVDEVGGD
jgi:hypothetical protein